MKPRQYFPLGKAHGEAFCNRTEQIKELAGNIKNGKHTFIAAPRRYGKSSLCENTLEKIGLPSAIIDLYIATSEKGIERSILKGILKLTGKAISKIDKSLQSIKYKFKNLKPKLSFETIGLQLEIEVIESASVPEAIQEMFLFLDALLISKNKQAVLLIDEFQRIIEVAPDMGIEAGIRSAAQEMQNLAIIFSGSNRHLIESIFQDEGRPLYKLCKKIKLDRIEARHYKKHLNKAAVKMWGEPLDKEAFECIMQITDRHPYYVNYVCDYLWTNNDEMPKSKNIRKLWTKIVEEERSDLLREYFAISENQKKLMRHIATTPPGVSLYSVETSKKIEMLSTSMPYALTGLLNKDLIEMYDNKQYRVINPCFKELLSEH